MTEFTFLVHYTDKSTVELLKQISFDDIPKNNIEGIEVKIGNATLIHVHLEEDQKIIFRKRGMAIPYDADKYPTVYLVGHRQNINGKDVQSIVYIVDYDGPNRKGFQIHVAGKFKDNHEFFYTPYLHKDEVFDGEKYYDPVEKVWKTK